MIKLGKKKSFVYSVMEADLRKQIREDVLKSGEKLLSESEFSSRYGISRRSVRQALANLTNERLIYSHAGSGCFVAENIPGKQPEHLRIVLILPEVDNAFMNELNHGVQIMAEESGCDLIYQSSGQSHEKERLHILHWLEEEKIDGMILFPMVGNHNTDLVFELKKRNMPFVLVDRFFQDIDTDYVMWKDYPKLADCLVRLPSLEPRVLNFFVKEGKHAFFEAEFNKEFGDKFLLMPMEEAIEKKLFGTGTPHEHFRAMLGDYLAIAISDLSIYYIEERWVSMHGSVTEDEMLIPLIVLNKPKEDPT
jgi:DNA-binding transcriptional regulator YhcF (GntR family)